MFYPAQTDHIHPKIGAVARSERRTSLFNTGCVGACVGGRGKLCFNRDFPLGTWFEAEEWA